MYLSAGIFAPEASALNQESRPGAAWELGKEGGKGERLVEVFSHVLHGIENQKGR
jgi:hypothetical protein